VTVGDGRGVLVGRGVTVRVGSGVLVGRGAAVGDGRGVLVGRGVGVRVGRGACVTVGRGVKVIVGMRVKVAVGRDVIDGSGVVVRVGMREAVAVGRAVWVGRGVAVLVDGRGVTVFVGVRVGRGVAVGDAVGVGVAVGGRNSRLRWVPASLAATRSTAATPGGILRSPLLATGLPANHTWLAPRTCQLMTTPLPARCRLTPATRGRLRWNICVFWGDVELMVTLMTAVVAPALLAAMRR
jgi:hypothetical protein